MEPLRCAIHLRALCWPVTEAEKECQRRVAGGVIVAEHCDHLHGGRSSRPRISALRSITSKPVKCGSKKPMSWQHVTCVRLGIAVNAEDFIRSAPVPVPDMAERMQVLVAG